MTPRCPRRRLRGETGAGGAEVIPLALLTFVIALLVIVNAWSVVDADLATTSAAREGVRAFVEAPDEATGLADATAAASGAIAGHGRSTVATTVSVAYIGDAGFARCGRVTVTVRHRMPTVRIPIIGGFGHGFDAVATDSEVIDPWRGGLDGEARC